MDAKERQALIAARNAVKLTQDQVAEQADISRTFYVHIEKGRRSPSLGVAFRIAKVVKRPVEEIFSDLVVSNRNNTVHSSQATNTA